MVYGWLVLGTFTQNIKEEMNRKQGVFDGSAVTTTLSCSTSAGQRSLVAELLYLGIHRS